MGGGDKPASRNKYWSLAILVVQNASLILTIRYSRTQHGDMYISSTAVVFAEFFKLIACLLLTLYESGNMTDWLGTLHTSILSNPLSTLKVAVPSFVYVVQNNLQFVAISNLDAASFQVSYQLKVLTTALFSVVMLQRKLTRTQWASLLLLFIGIAMVQLQPNLVATNKSPANDRQQKPMVGFLAVLVSSLCSGFAGVYFEKILKREASGGASIWVRNIQLGMFGLVLGVVAMLTKDGEKIRAQGVFFGYTPLVWMVVVMQAFGGLLVAVVVKNANSILKGFATSLAIILSCVVSLVVFDFVLSVQFVVGTCFVMVAVYLYGRA